MGAENTGSKRLKVIPPPLYFLACLLAGSVIHYRRPVPLGPYSFELGAGVGVFTLALAGTLGGWALLEMTRHRTPVEPWKNPIRLVTSGPFRLSRNPLYLTLTTVIVALSIIANSAWLLAAGVALLLLLDRLVVRREEVVLEDIFGSEYMTYKSRVRRWV